MNPTATDYDAANRSLSAVLDGVPDDALDEPVTLRGLDRPRRGRRTSSRPSATSSPGTASTSATRRTSTSTRRRRWREHAKRVAAAARRRHAGRDAVRRPLRADHHRRHPRAVLRVGHGRPPLGRRPGGRERRGTDRRRAGPDRPPAPTPSGTPCTWTGSAGPPSRRPRAPTGPRRCWPGSAAGSDRPPTPLPWPSGRVGAWSSPTSSAAGAWCATTTRTGRCPRRCASGCSSTRSGHRRPASARAGPSWCWSRPRNGTASGRRPPARMRPTAG